MLLRGRGRRPTFDREQALETALNLFWRYGYDGVSVADLTDAVGIAAPSLYHAFGSKAGLFPEVLCRYNSMGMSEAAVAAAPTSYEAVREALERGVCAVTRNDGPAGCMVSSGLLMTSVDNAEVVRELQTERTRFRVALERRIRQNIEAGVLEAATDAAALARFCASVLQGMSVQAIDGATSTELTAVSKKATDVWPGAPGQS